MRSEMQLRVNIVHCKLIHLEQAQTATEDAVTAAEQRLIDVQNKIDALYESTFSACPLIAPFRGSSGRASRQLGGGLATRTALSLNTCIAATIPCRCSQDTRGPASGPASGRRRCRQRTQARQRRCWRPEPLPRAAAGLAEPRAGNFRRRDQRLDPEAAARGNRRRAAAEARRFPAGRVRRGSLLAAGAPRASCPRRLPTSSSFISATRTQELNSRTAAHRLPRPPFADRAGTTPCSSRLR